MLMFSIIIQRSARLSLLVTPIHVRLEIFEYKNMLAEQSMSELLPFMNQVK